MSRVHVDRIDIYIYIYQSYIKPREIIPSDGARLVASRCFSREGRSARFWVNNSRAASTSNLSFSRTHFQNYPVIILFFLILIRNPEEFLFDCWLYSRHLCEVLIIGTHIKFFLVQNFRYSRHPCENLYNRIIFMQRPQDPNIVIGIHKYEGRSECLL